MRPLDPVLDGDLAPGSNLKGDVPGANWRFLLDDLAFERVLFVGSPSKATLHGLVRGSATSVSVLEARWSADDRLDLPDGTVDLVVVIGVRHAIELVRHARRCAELVRVATPEAAVVLDGHGLAVAGLTERLADGLERRRIASFFVTPHLGEIETAIPAAAPRVVRWFRDRGQLRPSLDKRDLARLSQRIQAGARRDMAEPARAHLASTPATERAGAPRALASRRLRAVVAATLDGVASIERSLDRVVAGARRSVVVLRPGVRQERVPPPRYVMDIASGAGVDLSGNDWGVAAGAEYASQKVLVPVFAAAATHPTYLVKLTREPAYSPRLERAADALERLASVGISDLASTPSVGFRGRAAGLAIVAETAIRGRPFRAAFRARADESDHGLAETVVCWLADLGVRTRTEEQATGDIEAAMDALITRYVERYRPDAAEEAFLRRTILAPSFAQGLPLVLQHGDPGPQNMLVTDDDRVRVVDWENADPLGLPLADVIYFLWTYAVLDGTARGQRDPVAASLPHLLEVSTLTPFFARSVAEYRQALGLDPAVLAPLFYASWLYQAVKEAARVPAHRVRDGMYRRVLAACTARPEAPGLRAFFPFPN